ncbi:minor capsid protein [Schaalia sp. lx-100]|uniref:minor capsid protein n=1 Tax=Schaalia sp. lx-100 TaxID=2899081 RepID=UPI001E60303F|nr:minor capsid protein [Schaalia sp. lx-100]MCD4558226.1 minor capsid protein [Schaalia sp. lx-100]
MTLEGLTQNVIDAIGTILTQAGVAFWPGFDGEYPASTQLPFVYAKRLPPDEAKALAINVYARENNISTGSTTVRVQVLCRCPREADTVADRVFDALHGLHHQHKGALRLARIRHISTAQLGLSPGGMDERSDNYEITLNL